MPIVIVLKEFHFYLHLKFLSFHVFQSVNVLCLNFLLSSQWEKNGESLTTYKSLTPPLCLTSSSFWGVTCFIHPDVSHLLWL